MQLSSRILTALAVLILAVAVVAVRAGSSDTVEAATGTIDVLNVGTCYTTSTDVFGAGDCDDGDDNVQDEPTEGYSVAGRTSITKVDAVYATYAIDPKTSGDQPRAIAINSDLIKISIEDEGRDKRTGVLYGVGTSAPTVPTQAQASVISGALRGLADDLPTQEFDPDGNPNSGDEVTDVTLTSTDAYFDGNDGASDTGTISNSGDAEFELIGTASATHPMASAENDRGKFYWFGTIPDQDGDGSPDFVNLTGEYITLDEDVASGDGSTTAPWMKVTASLPFPVDVDFIYYQTSEEEELVGGRNRNPVSADNPNGYPDGAEPPLFVDNEKNEKLAPLVLNADGERDAQNLWLKEDGRFSGRYVGYLRLTDADGDGKCDHDDDDASDPVRCNWGLTTDDAPDADNPAILGVESDPITIKYKNSKGDNKSITILIDKDAPAIQIDSPAHEAASKDDSPDLIGSFSDGGGSGLREDSFWVYADNTADTGDTETPIWDLRVNDAAAANTDRGRVCVAAEGASGVNGACDLDSAALLVLRSDYAGYSDTHPTYGILRSEEIYFPQDTNPADNDGLEYKRSGAEDFEDGATSGTFDTVVRIDFDPERDDNRYNHEIDIQAVVMDIAGNIGFSDSEVSDPNFIHGIGTKKADRGADNRHNVIGWYSRHIYYLDDVDPEYEEDQSATGFFLDSDGDEMRTGSGLMVVFDGKIDASTVGIGTFDVQLDSGTDATVLDARVKDSKVYLLIEEVLAPDATPKVDLAAGQAISDRAGNESTDRRLDGIELSDGILPTFTVTLSGGTGLNEDIDGEGPSELTKGQMKISISANEAIQGSPQFAVVCSNLTWGANEDNNVAKFASNRTNAFTSGDINDAEPNATHNVEPSTGDDTRTMCPGYDDGGYFEVAGTLALARPGNNWEYQWSKLSAEQAVEDGKLSVIVWGRDRSSYETGDGTVYNYSASTTNFVYDTKLKAAWNADYDGELVPTNGENVFETRPFVLIDFDKEKANGEKTTVDVTMFKVDGTDRTSELQILENNEFVWWPEPLAYGTYEIYVEANDAANNPGDHTYSFTVKERSPFVLSLLAGWNSISFPANPVDRALHAVFTDPAIDQVIGWDATETVSPWRMATRVDGVWTISEEVATLNDVEARYGYWVHSQGFITQAVKLAGKGDRSTDGQPNPADIPTDEGWNFVGVVDVDGDQTQDDAGETLRNSDNFPITAGNYLGNYTRAYTWDHINNTWDVLKNNEDIIIGTGIWVYYTKGHNIAP